MASQQLPKELEILYHRTPNELQRELDTLPPEAARGALEALNSLHHVMEREIYQLTLRLIQALRFSR